MLNENTWWLGYSRDDIKRIEGDPISQRVESLGSSDLEVWRYGITKVWSWASFKRVSVETDIYFDRQSGLVVGYYNLARKLKVAAPSWIVSDPHRKPYFQVGSTKRTVLGAQGCPSAVDCFSRETWIYLHRNDPGAKPSLVGFSSEDKAKYIEDPHEFLKVVPAFKDSANADLYWFSSPKSR